MNAEFRASLSRLSTLAMVQAGGCSGTKVQEMSSEVMGTWDLLISWQMEILLVMVYSELAPATGIGR